MTPDSAPEPSETTSLLSKAQARFSRKRFWWLCGLGVAALITLQLFFLPRTSPNRDFRRWHNLHLTKTDVKRIFLVQSSPGHPDAHGGSVESNMRAWLDTLSAINAKSPASVAASSAPQLAAHVDKQMRSMGFDTALHEYSLPSSLRAPVSSELQLVDDKSSRVLYSARSLEPGFATPAYFLFSQNGSVEAKLVYANAGTPDDLALLQKSVPIKGRIVVFCHMLTSEYALHDKIAHMERLGAVGVVVYGPSDINTAVSRNYRPPTPPPQSFRLPVSYESIKPVLEAMGTASGPFASWKIAPTPPDDSLKLRLSCNFSSTPLYATNIIAKIDGALRDSELVIGASRDVLTAANPSSGQAVLLEIMRRFRYLQELGWIPLRTIRFVSWDGSRSGALGSLANAQDQDVFKTNMPILAYINLDDDLITGSHFTVDANPIFNHVLQRTSQFVPFPRKSTYFKRLCESEGKELLSDDGDTTLYEYWKKQDGANINNKLGYSYAGKDAATFQMMMDAPSISIKFTPSPNYNDSVYIPESNAYSLKWVKNEVDQNMDLHSSVVRFVGLLVLSLTEHEVVDSRTKPYFTKAWDFFTEFRDRNQESLDKMADVEAKWPFYKKSTLYSDLSDQMGDEVHTVADIVSQMDSLMNDTVAQAAVFDSYNQEVEVLWATDFPWYKMIRKMHIYAKFKVSNYKLLRMEKELGRSEEVHDEDDEQPRYHHFMYDLPTGARSIKEKQEQGAFGSFYDAAGARDAERLVRLTVAKYERLKSVYKHMT